MSIVSTVVIEGNVKIITTVTKVILKFHPVLADLARRPGETLELSLARTVREEVLPEVSDDVLEVETNLAGSSSGSIERSFVPLSGLLELIPKGRAKAYMAS